MLKRRLLKQPRYLYRYSSLKEEERINHLMDTLKNNRLYCASPSTFNDPFDVRPRSRMEFDTDKFKKFYFNYGITYAKNLFEVLPETEKELRALIEQRYKELLADPDRVHTHFRNIGIRCLSEQENNLLMWAHYTSGHNGYCLKFKSPTWSSNEVSLAYKVEYKRTYPKIDIEAWYAELPKPMHKRNLNTIFEANRSIAMIKSPHWKYEKEWRLLRPEPGYVNFNRDSLEYIALGTNVKNSVVEKVIKTIKEEGLSIKVLRAELDRRAFRLNYIPKTKD